MKLPFLLPKTSLGIDIGTSFIRVVALSSFAGRIKLDNYGEISSQALYQRPFRTFEKSTLLLASEDIIKAIKAIFEEAKIRGKTAFFSLPDFASFFTTFELPPMEKDELPFAVEAEARRHVPFPLGEVIWDWQLIERSPIGKKEKFKVLLVSVPKDVVNQYRTIAKSLEIPSFSLEAEVFSLARAICEKKEGVVAIVDIGARTTSCSIIERRTLKISRSFDISGDDFTHSIAKSFAVDQPTAEKLKKKYGLSSVQSYEGKEVREILIPLVDSILNEINQTLFRFSASEKKEVEKIILAGGEANLPGLPQYFKDYLKKEVEIANPFKKIYFPPILEKTLKEMGPSFSIAVGLALRAFE
jgi:type IV pilus assembly protein PilM